MDGDNVAHLSNGESMLIRPLRGSVRTVDTT